jgi:hypothetical protein
MIDLHKIISASTSPALRTVMAVMERDARRLSGLFPRVPMMVAPIGEAIKIGAPTVSIATGIKALGGAPVLKIASAIGARPPPIATVPRVFPRIPQII